MPRTAGTTPSQGKIPGIRPTATKQVWPKSVWPRTAWPKSLWSRAHPGKPDAELLSDADLLELTALGDYKAFVRLYASVSPRVSATVRHLLAELSTTDESATVVREVFVDVWQLAPQFEEIAESTHTPVGGVPVITGAESTAWILKVARRRAIDRLRSVRAQNHTRRHTEPPRTPRRSAPRPAPPQSSGDPSSGHPLSTTEHPAPPAPAAHLPHPDCKLTAPERETIALAFGGGYTEDEVATILDVRVGTVRTRLHRGLLRLQVSSRAQRGGHHPADNTRRVKAELEECEPCHRSARLLLEPSHRGAGEAAASILHSLTPSATHHRA